MGLQRLGPALAYRKCLQAQGRDQHKGWGLYRPAPAQERAQRPAKQRWLPAHSQRVQAPGQGAEWSPGQQLLAPALERAQRPVKQPHWLGQLRARQQRSQRMQRQAQRQAQRARTQLHPVHMPGFLNLTHALGPLRGRPKRWGRPPQALTRLPLLAAGCSPRLHELLRGC